MIFDTDVLIWIQRGNKKAADIIDKTEERYISAMTYLELVQCAQTKIQLKITRNFFKECGFIILPFTENIGHRAMIYIEEYALSGGLRAGDALIAATAAENAMSLCTGNARHFKCLSDIDLVIFKP